MKWREYNTNGIITKVKQLSFLNMKEMETKMINVAEMLIKMFKCSCGGDFQFNAINAS